MLSALLVGRPQFACAGRTPNTVIDALHKSAMAKLRKLYISSPTAFISIDVTCMLTNLLGIQYPSMSRHVRLGMVCRYGSMTPGCV